MNNKTNGKQWGKNLLHVKRLKYHGDFHFEIAIRYGDPAGIEHI